MAPQVKDRRVARVVKACQELPGQHLFQYIDADSESRAVTSSDVNDYLRGITGVDITANDFRTWAGNQEGKPLTQGVPGLDQLTAAPQGTQLRTQSIRHSS